MPRAAFSHFRDGSFIERLISQDAAAVTEVVEAYSDHLYKTGLGMGLSPEISREVCMACWATFFEVLPRFQGRSHIRTFLFGIFYNKAFEERRQSSKFEKTDPIEEVMEGRFLEDGHWKEGTQDPSDLVENSETIGIVGECLEHLPIQQKAAFIHKIVEEEKSEDICHILDISKTNLRQLLFRGKNRLRECVEKKLKA